MAEWRLSAAVCLNEKREVLMVLQGKPEEDKKWAVPAGVAEEGETLEQCCEREAYEETSYKVKVVEKLHIKKNDIAQIHYYLVEIVGGEMTIHDPDELIHDIAWRKINEMSENEFGFPEDRTLLLEFLETVV
ncbi:NUDIX hydrolase [Bacillaceae bacterium W0354]